MAVTLRFEADQPHQLRAIQAVVSLFDGQRFAPTAFEIAPVPQWQTVKDVVTGNALAVDPLAITENLRRIQAENAIPAEFRIPEGLVVDPLDFTIEMETGTGKTYVYLRSALELNSLYGFTKFVVVVPSVAIREGVLSNLRLLNDHFKAIYSGAAYRSRVYDAANPSELRAFAQSNELEILVINIDSFNKTDTNLIYRGRDSTMGIPPIDFIRGTNPIVILDEPQNLEGDAAKAGIAELHPLVTVRYSATHKSMPNPIFRLTPADAYSQGLVKQIEVWSVTEDEDLNKPYVKLESVRATGRSVTASAIIGVATRAGVRQKKVRLAADRDGLLPDLFGLSGEREVYRGYAVEDIRADRQEVVFGNGVRIQVGQEIGPDLELLQRTQIRTAVEQHLEREQDLADRFARGDLPAPMKPLTLFFIDRVANYHPADGKFRLWFEETYEALAPRYASLGLPPVSEVHDGYFAVDRAGPKDTNGRTQADDKAYRLIMERKDELLSFDEPLRFIFSHSALREGWDNPNVFVIANLNATKSEVKKRQEIGRGLRLPVMENGDRSFDVEVNRLSVIANESYDTFAAALQREIEDETSTVFERGLIKDARIGRKVRLRSSVRDDPAFAALWDRIKVRTRFMVDFDTGRVIENAATRLANESKILAPAVRVSGASVRIDQVEGVTAEAFSTRRPFPGAASYPIPDLLGHLSQEVPLARHTIASVLVSSGRLGEVTVNPQRFLDQAQVAMKQALAEEMLHGIKYAPIGDDPDHEYAMTLLTEREATSFSRVRLDLPKSAFDEVMFGSGIEEAFARALELRDDVLLFMKLPWWFKVDTPVGNYNPDWAIVLGGPNGAERCYLVRETKGVSNFASLPDDQRLKISYGERHFEAIDADYAWVSRADHVVCAPSRPTPGESSDGGLVSSRLPGGRTPSKRTRPK